MKFGPNDNDIKIEIDEIGIEGMLESMIPGSEDQHSQPLQTPQTESESSGIDDPFGF